MLFGYKKIEMHVNQLIDGVINIERVICGWIL